MIVACHWNMLSPVGPALQEEGGARPRSIISCTSQRAERPHATQGRAAVSIHRPVKTAAERRTPKPPHPAEQAPQPDVGG